MTMHYLIMSQLEAHALKEWLPEVHRCEEPHKLAAVPRGSHHMRINVTGGGADKQRQHARDSMPPHAPFRMAQKLGEEKDGAPPHAIHARAKLARAGREKGTQALPDDDPGAQPRGLAEPRRQGGC